MMIKRLFELPMHSLPILQETPTYHDIVEILEDSVQSTKLQSSPEDLDELQKQLDQQMEKLEKEKAELDDIKSQVTAMKKSTQEKKYSVKK